MSQGEYYLHTNGSLIYKPHGGVDPSSDFVKMCWNTDIIGKSPDVFARFLRSAYRAGAKLSEIDRLAEHNNLKFYIPNWEHIVFDAVLLINGIRYTFDDVNHQKVQELLEFAKDRPFTDSEVFQEQRLLAKRVVKLLKGHRPELFI